MISLLYLILILTGHGAELPYVFHTCELTGCKYTPEERELADTVSEYWGNFVNTGNPNQPPGQQDIEGSCEAEGCTVSAR